MIQWISKKLERARVERAVLKQVNDERVRLIRMQRSDFGVLLRMKDMYGTPYYHMHIDADRRVQHRFAGKRLEFWGQILA